MRPIPENFLLFNASQKMKRWQKNFIYEGWNFNSGNYLFTTDTK